MDQPQLLPHLFRTEFSKIVAVLCKRLGVAHLETAEDLASETFLAAMESWTYKGLPPNPTAWLYHVAKNKARNYMIRSALFVDKIAPDLRQDNKPDFPDLDLSEQHISDSQLQMLFVLCHPAIPPESQIGLSLRILCGFGIEEIANAFLTNKETINKRLMRAREKLREENIAIAFPPPSEISGRPESVLTTLYLLFNEGYYSESHDSIIRKDLCLEAMRLTYLLAANPATDSPPTNALLSLMCFHASRLDSRQSASGELILYRDQDETLWNQELIARGKIYLQKASTGDRVSSYHLEASIAFWHTIKVDSPDKWENILSLYDQLLQLNDSPMVALNRIFAFYKVNGKELAIPAAERLNLVGNRYFHMLLGTLYKGVDSGKSEQNYRRAIQLATTTADRLAIQRQMNGN